MTSDAAAREAFIYLGNEKFAGRVDEIIAADPMGLPFLVKLASLTQQVGASGMDIHVWIKVLDLQTEILRLASDEMEKKGAKP